MTSTTDPWDGGWETDRRTKRAAWAAMTPTERLAWLEEALDLARRTGALAEERRRRQQEADRVAADMG